MDKEMTDRMLSRFVPVQVPVDCSALDENRKKIVAELIKAGEEVMDIFWEQTSPDAKEWIQKYSGPKDKDKANLVKMNGGPYERLSHFKPFPGAPGRPKGGGFYPRNITREEFEASAKEDPSLLDPYTMVVRKDGKLQAVPYHEYFKDQTERMVTALREAAGYAENRSLRTYLLSKAEDLQKDDYFQSDCDWIDLDDPLLDVVIGPYEVYEDELMGLKAAHEAVIMLNLPKEQDLVKQVEAKIPELSAWVWPHSDPAGGATPIRVVDSIYRSGDGAVGYQFVAFNLPNDPVVRREKGAKKVLHRNFLRARLEKIIRPVGEALLVPQRAAEISFDGLFKFVLMHENCHSMGPQFIKGSKDISIGSALKETYVVIEEAKADTSGMATAALLMEQGLFEPQKARGVCSTFVAAQLRSIRFQGEAHAVAAQISLSRLAEKGVLSFTDQGIDVDCNQVFPVLRDLSNDLMQLQYQGDQAQAAAFIEKYGTTQGDFLKVVDTINHYPVEMMPDIIVKGL